MYKLSHWVMFVVMGFWASGGYAAANVSAEAYVIADATTGAVLESYNPHVKRQPASTTKLVTAMLVADKVALDTWVTISHEASQQPRRKAYLAEGHRYQAADLLKALLALSANDAATALAEAVAGSEAKFTELMTLKAKQCGAFNTKFQSAAGLTREDQYSTAYDLSRIMQCARGYEVIREYSRIRKDTIQSDQGKRHLITSHNRLFTESPFYSIGKTGYTNLAKYTYVSYLKQNEQDTIIAMLGSNQLWKDANELAAHSMELIKPDHSVSPLITTALAVERRIARSVASVEPKPSKSASRQQKTAKSSKSGGQQHKIIVKSVKLVGHQKVAVKSKPATRQKIAVNKSSKLAARQKPNVSAQSSKRLKLDTRLAQALTKQRRLVTR